MHKSLLTILMSTLLMSASSMAQFPFQKGDKVCIVGNSLSERMQHDGWMESLIHRETKGLDLTFRNLSASGDQPNNRPRSQNVPDHNALLAQSKADVIFCFFGYNESFAGQDGVEKFKKELSSMIDGYRAKNFNGKNSLRLVLFSPIGHENLKLRFLPDGSANNNRLHLYAEAIRQVAEEKKETFVDLFKPSLELYDWAKSPLTINGVHLSEEGNRQIAEVIASALTGKKVASTPADEKLRAAVNVKNIYWHNCYRASDSNDVWGNRAGLKFVNNQSNGEVLQHEIKMWEQLTANRDPLVWALAAGKDYKVDDSNVPPPIPVISNVGGGSKSSNAQKEGSTQYLNAVEGISQMKVAPGFKVNLFADEKKFPELANPVQMAVDTKGRLWAAAWATYPMWEPLKEMNDRLLIFPDENRDGIADKCITFAKVHNPTAFEFWNGGVLVASCPDILFLKDTNGDDVADVRQVYLQGLDGADTHHAANNFRFGPDGGLYWQRGVFIVENVETPWVTSFEAKRDGMYRFDPLTFTFSFHAPNGPNSHGIIFDSWGYHYATDGTSGNAFQVVPSEKGFKMRGLLKKEVRPVPACGIVSSAHFPEAMQQNFLICNTIGFLGIKQYKLDRNPETGEVNGTPVEELISSSDKNFRPTDVEFGGDGALYFSDWQNVIIGHMQHNVRDPQRDKTHGRIYRMTADGRKLQDPVKIDGEPIAALLKNLEHPIDGIRYRTQIELTEHNPDEVAAACKEWIKQFDPKNPAHAHHLTEALWLLQRVDVKDQELLAAMLASPEPHAKIAAKTVNHYWSGNAIDQQSRAVAKEVEIKSIPPVVRADGTLEVQLLTVMEALRYDTVEFNAKPGQKVEINFINVDAPPHNVVITKPGAADKICLDAIAMGPDGFAKGFIPESNDILAHSKMLDQGQKETIKFTLPAEAGDYQFVCTFPSHGAAMRGIIHVK